MTRAKQGLMIGLVMAAILVGCGKTTRTDEEPLSSDTAPDTTREQVETAESTTDDSSVAYTGLSYDSTEAARRQQETADRLGVPKELTLDCGNGVQMKLVLIPEGVFMMGSPNSESKRHGDEGPVLFALISRPFYMSTTEVTQAQYQAVTGQNPSYFKGATLPVEQVSWDDAVAFCQKLSTRAGRTVDLPTEAQWEYACRAGTDTPFNTGETISADQANYNADVTYGNGRQGVYREKTTPVGNFAANAFGLYDMHGNVCEWCFDWYGRYVIADADDRQGPPSGRFRILRGGCWSYYPENCRSATRKEDYPRRRYEYFGFRVVLNQVTVETAD